jgi:molybdate transport repressor ModE-like protein
VESEAGGFGGGRTKLTPEGERLLAHYHAFRAAAEADVKRNFGEERYFLRCQYAIASISAKGGITI